MGGVQPQHGVAYGGGLRVVLDRRRDVGPETITQGVGRPVGTLAASTRALRSIPTILPRALVSSSSPASRRYCSTGGMAGPPSSVPRESAMARRVPIAA